MAIVWPDPDNSTYWQGDLMTTKGAAKALGVSVQTIRNYNKDKRFPSPTKKIEGGRHYYLYSRKIIIAIDDKIKEIRGGR
jgi:DNA-binding transcriptional MerR regulator